MTTTNTTADLSEIAEELGIKFFLFSFVDLCGGLRSKLVPASAASSMQKSGAGFAGFATDLDLSPADPDMMCVPDVSSLIQLPWKKEVGWLACNPMMSGKIVDQAPRNVLNKQIADLKELGYQMKTGVEVEFFLLDKDEVTPFDKEDKAPKPCYDQSALMRNYEFISELITHMNTLGWKAYQADHEDAQGQFEINWEYDDCLVTADRHVFMKYMVKELAEKNGMRATFMPKPMINLTGSGLHAHITLHPVDGSGTNLFKGGGEMGLSPLCYSFMGGILHHARALCAISNPTVNSYKRINAPSTVSGSTWAPQSISYTGNNRTHMIRIPDEPRFELRLADSAANPYLLQGALIATGIAGIQGNMQVPARQDTNQFTSPPVPGAKILPLSLTEALTAFAEDSTLRETLGASFADAYMKIKHKEWQSYAAHLSEWEMVNYLNI